MVIDMAAPTNGRRQFLGGLLAAGLIPAPTWADAGSPAFLSAAAKPDGSFVLCGIGAELDIRFELALPARGHAAAAHPIRPEAVAFARRPGTFAVVIDCVTGAQTAMLSAPTGRHFYGHGTFSSDGSLLYTTENDYEAGRGRIGVWDAQHGYQRIDEWDSGGIGPHDIKRLPHIDTLVVANGGIDTHPDTGRTKLNIATMAPNLAYVENGDVIEIATLPPELHKNSIRHLAVGPEGQVAFGMQWQGDGDAPTLVGIHQQGGAMNLMQVTSERTRAMEGYVGSIAFSPDGTRIAATSPRGGLIQVYATQTLLLLDEINSTDVCGVTHLGEGFAATSGTGAIAPIGFSAHPRPAQYDLAWDNHLIRL
jgi:hypothetical protein